MQTDSYLIIQQSFTYMCAEMFLLSTQNCLCKITIRIMTPCIPHCTTTTLLSHEDIRLVYHEQSSVVNREVESGVIRDDPKRDDFVLQSNGKKKPGLHRWLTR